jgi:hypothetical protein
MLETLAGLVDGTAFALWAARDPLAYPVANVVHLLGLVMLVGGIGLLDLRLAGAFRAIPVMPLAAAVTPWGVCGLLLLVASGSVLFAADATALSGSQTFSLKLILLGLGLTNALLFRLWWQKRLPTWDSSPPLAGRLMAVASLLMWLGVAGLGRWIAYS